MSGPVAKVLLFGLALLLAEVHAASNELRSQLKSTNRFGISATMHASSDFYEADNADHKAESKLIFAPTYKITEAYRFTLTQAVMQDFTDDTKTQLSNTKLMLSHSPITLTQNSMLMLGAGGRLPVNEDDHRDNTYNGALIVEPNLITEWNIGGHGFSTIFGVHFFKNFHTYDRNNESKPNMDYQFSNSLGIGTHLTRKVSLALAGEYVYARSYQDTPKSLFDIAQSLTYAGDKWSLSVGHSNGGKALQANGRDYDVHVFDQNTSIVYGDLSVTY